MCLPQLVGASMRPPRQHNPRMTRLPHARHSTPGKGRRGHYHPVNVHFAVRLSNFAGRNSCSVGTTQLLILPSGEVVSGKGWR